MEDDTNIFLNMVFIVLFVAVLGVVGFFGVPIFFMASTKTTSAPSSKKKVKIKKTPPKKSSPKKTTTSIVEKRETSENVTVKNARQTSDGSYLITFEYRFPGEEPIDEFSIRTTEDLGPINGDAEENRDPQGSLSPEGVKGSPPHSSPVEFVLRYEPGSKLQEKGREIKVGVRSKRKQDEGKETTITLTRTFHLYPEEDGISVEPPSDAGKQDEERLEEMPKGED